MFAYALIYGVEGERVYVTQLDAQDPPAVEAEVALMLSRTSAAWWRVIRADEKGTDDVSIDVTEKHEAMKLEDLYTVAANAVRSYQAAAGDAAKPIATIDKVK